MAAEEKPSAQIRLERLLYANLSLATEMSVDRVLQKVTDVAVELIGCRYAALGVLGADGHTLESFTTTGITPEDRRRIGALPRGHGILGLVIREATVVRLPVFSPTRMNTWDFSSRPRPLPPWRTRDCMARARGSSRRCRDCIGRGNGSSRW
jgi:hypothetical protein